MPWFAVWKTHHHFWVQPSFHRGSMASAKIREHACHFITDCLAMKQQCRYQLKQTAQSSRSFGRRNTWKIRGVGDMVEFSSGSLQDTA